MATKAELEQVLSEIRQQQRLSEPARFQGRANLREKGETTVQLSEIEIRNMIAAAVRPLEQKTAAAVAENTQLRHRLGLFNEREEREHTATCMETLCHAADVFVGESIPKGKASKKDRLRRETARAVFTLGRSAIRANGWRL